MSPELCYITSSNSGLSLRYAIRKTKFINLTKYITVFAASFSLAFLSGSLAFIPRSSNAETANTAADPSVAILNLSVIPSSQNSAISLSDDHTQNLIETIATVNTDSSTGYALTMNAKNDYTNGKPGTSLIHSNGDDQIPSTANSKLGALSNNTWGYNKGANPDSFRKIPPLRTPSTLTVTNTSATNPTTIITFGTNSTTPLPINQYTSTITFTALAN